MKVGSEIELRLLRGDQLQASGTVEVWQRYEI